MSRLLRFLIKDREAFGGSIRNVVALDFERIVVAHGDPILENAKARFFSVFSGLGFDLDD